MTKEQESCPYCRQTHADSTAICPNVESVMFVGGGAATFTNSKLVEFLTADMLIERLTRLEEENALLKKTVASYDSTLGGLYEDYDALRAQIQTVATPCEWKNDDDPDTSSDAWDTACGEMFTWVGGEGKAQIPKFCPGCGHPAILSTFRKEDKP